MRWGFIGRKQIGRTSLRVTTVVCVLQVKANGVIENGKKETTPKSVAASAEPAKRGFRQISNQNFDGIAAAVAPAQHTSPFSSPMQSGLFGKGPAQPVMSLSQQVGLSQQAANKPARGSFRPAEPLHCGMPQGGRHVMPSPDSQQQNTWQREQQALFRQPRPPQPRPLQVRPPLTKSQKRFGTAYSPLHSFFLLNIFRHLFIHLSIHCMAGHCRGSARGWAVCLEPGWHVPCSSGSLRDQVERRKRNS